MFSIQKLPHARLLLGCLGSALALTACGRVGGFSGPPTNAAAEVEPNGDAFNANWFGTLVPGERLEIVGHVSDFGFDLYDGFAFRAAETMVVSFSVTAWEPFTDLDVCWYDPVSDQFIECFESPFDPERGEFLVYAGEEFHLVVTSFFGASGYTLDVRANCCALALGSGDGDGAAQERAAGTSERGHLERLEAYRKAAQDEVAEQDDDEAVFETMRGVLIDFDAGGGVRSLPFRILSQGAVLIETERGSS